MQKYSTFKISLTAIELKAEPCKTTKTAEGSLQSTVDTEIIRLPHLVVYVCISVISVKNKLNFVCLKIVHTEALKD